MPSFCSKRTLSSQIRQRCPSAETDDASRSRAFSVHQGACWWHGSMHPYSEAVKANSRPRMSPAQLPGDPRDHPRQVEEAWRLPGGGGASASEGSGGLPRAGPKGDNSPQEHRGLPRLQAKCPNAVWKRHPRRWSRDTRCWRQQEVAWINPLEPDCIDTKVAQLKKSD
jgi:hypothetical protein